ncbi:CoA transferase [Streptosporangium jomthongense]|uniref:CoA transferase n=1 Tax=Streptosporangium jomthongense TaxID=1193683 RepID=A0ABV8F6K0_9ACTN
MCEEREEVVEDLVRRLGAEVGVELPPLRVTGAEPVLPSVFHVDTAAAVSVGAATAAAAGLGGGVGAEVDVREAAVAFLDERHFMIDGVRPAGWAALSGDYRTVDGWVRLHCNFDHHRDAALAALGLPTGADGEAVARACAGRTAFEVEEVVTAEGGCAAMMRSRAGWRAHPQRAAVARSPLVGLTRIGDGPVRAPGGRRDRPLDGVRVLDLTRVIAGPVATRTLAAHGARVLRVGAGHLPEVPGLVVGTAFGKRSCHLDLRTARGAAALRDLVAGAEVFVQSYRPGALEALGFGPEELAGIRPGIVCVDLSAYGAHGPWAGRRGFDSLVQMVCGIAHEGGGGAGPRPLPAQALDHATGYLAAFGAMAALTRRSREGGSWRVEVSLARTALWLDSLGRAEAENVTGKGPRVADLLSEMDSPFGRLTYVRAPGSVDGARPYWTSPPPGQGEHPPAWW